MNNKPTLAQKNKFDSLNIVAGCKVQQINEDTMKWETIGEVLYTPYSINQFMKQHKLASVWVNILGSREMWFKGKGRLATR